MKTIRLLLEWKNGTTTWPAGSLLEMKGEDADALIADNTAELVDLDAEKKAAEAALAQKSDEEKRTIELIGQTVKGVIDSLPISRPVAVVKEGVDSDPNSGFKNFGDFCKAVKDAGSPGQQVDKRLLAANAKAPQGLNVGIDAEGGFLVPEEMSSNLMEKTYATAQVVSKCTRVPMTSQVVKIPTINETSRADGSRSGGVRAYYKAEAAQYTDSQPAFGQVKLELNKLTGLVYDTDELLRWSAVSIEPLLSRLFADEFAFVIDDKIINGTGAGQPLGILNAPALIEVAKEGAQPADTIFIENVVKMWARLFRKQNAVWFVSSDISPQLMTMTLAVGAAGVPVYMPPGGISAAPYATLFGKPIIEIEQCDTLGDKGDIILADMSQYLYAENSDGIQGATSIHLRFDYGETALRWTLWNDGQPWWASALTPKNGGSTLSPFVTLAARA